MGDPGRKPFTMRERRRWPQDRLGFRYTNEWCSGDLPAPFASGDVLWLPKDAEISDDQRKRLTPFEPGHHFMVVYGPSIDEGDAWYFRVEQEGSDDFECSGRMHVAFAARSNYPDLNLLEHFELVDTQDPEGLAERERLLAAGWQMTPTIDCPSCGRPMKNRSGGDHG